MAVGVFVKVEVALAINIAVDVAVAVGFGLRLGFGVAEGGGGGIKTSVFVGLGITWMVFIAGTTAVAEIVVAAIVPVGRAVPVDFVEAAIAGALMGSETPGVRTRSIHAGLVRMAGSTGSMYPFGRFVRKSLFGSITDSALAFNTQKGAKRSAHPPASSRHKSPKRRIRRIIIQSRLSFSVVFMREAV